MSSVRFLRLPENSLANGPKGWTKWSTYFPAVETKSVWEKLLRADMVGYLASFECKAGDITETNPIEGTLSIVAKLVLNGE
jgi:hypothetical protein